MSDTHDEISVPGPIPEPGFYYHYKHDPNGSENGYAYEVMGVGHHTEDEKTFMVVYRPLYDWALVYKLGHMFDLRPLDMFMEAVDKPEYQGPRFTKIENPELIARLGAVRDEMYG